MPDRVEYKKEWRRKNLERIREHEASPQVKYNTHKAHAKYRGIPFRLSFDDWWTIWQESGKWNERRRGGYCMCRFNDSGAYELGNVRIDSPGANIKEWQQRKYLTFS